MYAVIVKKVNNGELTAIPVLDEFNPNTMMVFETEDSVQYFIKAFLLKKSIIIINVITGESWTAGYEKPLMDATIINVDVKCEKCGCRNFIVNQSSRLVLQNNYATDGNSPIKVELKCVDCGEPVQGNMIKKKADDTVTSPDTEEKQSNIKKEVFQVGTAGADIEMIVQKNEYGIYFVSFMSYCDINGKRRAMGDQTILRPFNSVDEIYKQYGSKIKGVKISI